MIHEPPPQIDDFNWIWRKWLNGLWEKFIKPYPLLSGETGVVNYEHEYGNVLRYGAMADAGVTDSTTFLANAASSGFNVYFPAVTTPSTDYYKTTAAITAGHAGQKFYGDGFASVVRQVTNNTNVFSGTNLNNLTYFGLHVYCVGVKSSINNDIGIYLDGCDDCTIKGNYVENHRNAGIGLKDSNSNLVTENNLFNSPVIATDTHDEAGNDIIIFYSSSYNIVSNNTIDSGNGQGIAITTILTSETCEGNLVTGNIIDNSRMYGIMIYELNSLPIDNIISSNIVRNITGAVEHLTNGFVYGAGIYIQGTEHTIIDGNHIYNTNTSTVSNQLAPGSIGTTNCSNFVIANNVIRDASWYGVTIRDPNATGNSTGYGVVSGNVLESGTKAAIEVLRRGRVKIDGNTIDSTAANGIEIANTSSKEECSIINNSIRGTTGIDISVSYMDELLIANNMLDSSSNAGMSIDNSSSIVINANYVRDASVRGIYVQSSCSDIAISNNTVISGGVGFKIDANAEISNNKAALNTTDWQGSYSAHIQNETLLYDFSVDGGGVGIIVLGQMPDNATITDAWYEVIAAPTSGGSATIAFGVSTDDSTGLKTATAYGSYTTGYADFTPDGTATNYTTKTAARRDVIMTIATAALTAGKIRIYYKYSVSE